MNIKKNIMKTMCAALACSTFLSNLIPVYATEAIITESPMDEANWTVDESSFEEIEVTYKQPSDYSVTIPKTIALDSKKQAGYSVKVTGDIDTKQRVYVAPIDGISGTENIDFYMKDQASDSRKEDVVATVTQNKFYWDSEEVADGYEETNNSINAPNLTAGTWKGTFQVSIKLETNVGHTHNYVDGICTECGEKAPNAEHEHSYVNGICECGAIDPNHTHNYENGVCTICGEADSETNQYEVAPIGEIDNWNYTLDDSSNIVTLNYYIGDAVDVTVYARYKVNDTIYKTRLASFGENDTALGSYMFSNKNGIQSISFNDGIDTSSTTDMSQMFYSCTSLTSLDVSNLDTSKVTNMYAMFRSCESLASLDVSNFDTSQVTSMNAMFCLCKSLTSLDVSNFDTSKVTNMGNMFEWANSLTSLDLSNFDTSQVTIAAYMFRYCTSLKSLEGLSNWNTSNFTEQFSMLAMFMNCSNLTSLDLRNWNISKATDVSYLFLDCSNLKTIYVTRYKWVTSQAKTTDMFSGCGTKSVTYK